MVESAPIESHTDDDAEFVYRPVERWAIASLLLGLCSPLALIAPVMWTVPILAWVSGGVALAKIRNDAGRPGRTLVLLGLALATFFIVLPISRFAAARVMLNSQPRPVADQFLEYLRQGSPEKALTLNFVPDFRAGLSKNLWLYFRSDADGKADLKKFVSHPMIRMILALGDKAEIRYYETTSVSISGKIAHVGYLYSVTFTDDDQKKKTFFVSLLLERKPTTDPTLNPWRIRNFGGGTDPS